MKRIVLAGLLNLVALPGPAPAQQPSPYKLTSIERLAKDLNLSSSLKIEQIAKQANVAAGIDFWEVEENLRNFSRSVRKFRFSPQARADLIREFGVLGKDMSDFFENQHTFPEAWDKVVDAIKSQQSFERAEAIAEAFGINRSMMRVIRD